MSQPLLVLDTHYLCHRAFHTMKDLSWKGRATGVIFGFLKTISVLKDEFQTDQIAFCFESYSSFRGRLFANYKKSRWLKEDESQEKRKARLELAGQIVRLKEDFLPRIGFKNVFWFDGYESDDIMAVLASVYSEPLGTVDGLILVTADSDLYQCLEGEVAIYDPGRRKIKNKEWFVNRYGIRPQQWAKVKAIAGCHTDEVPGISGVGEVTALKYVKGELSKSSKAYQAIVSAEGKAIVRRNRSLVQLPFKGCPIPRIQEDNISPRQWRDVCAELGMRSIAGRPPIATRKMRQMIISL